jgi:hypothetical protein
LYAASTAGNLGIPGRFLKEYHRKWRNPKSGLLISWHQVELYQQLQHSREQLYPRITTWWREAEVPAEMYVPQPFVVACRGSALLKGDPLHWVIFCKEWTALVFSRYVADGQFRGLFWQLPRRVRGWITTLGLTTLLLGSQVSVEEVSFYLTEHDNLEWIRYQVAQVGTAGSANGESVIIVAPIHYLNGKFTIKSMATIVGATSWGDPPGFDTVPVSHTIAPISAATPRGRPPMNPSFRSDPAPELPSAHALPDTYVPISYCSSDSPYIPHEGGSYTRELYPAARSDPYSGVQDDGEFNHLVKFLREDGHYGRLGMYATHGVSLTRQQS